MIKMGWLKNRKRRFIFIGLFQGIVDEVRLTKSEETVERLFKEYTGVSIANSVLLEDTDYSGSIIVEVKEE